MPLRNVPRQNLLQQRKTGIAPLNDDGDNSDPSWTNRYRPAKGAQFL
jgi:hypothetical protein